MDCVEEKTRYFIPFYTEFKKFTHDVEEAFHDVEEVFQDVKDHVLLSVRSSTYMIAFLLMAVTAAILVLGTVYVWCFHHGRPHREQEEVKEKKETAQNAKSVSKKKSKLKLPTVREKQKEREKDNSQEQEVDIVPQDKEIDKLEEKNSDSELQNGEIRQRSAYSSSEPDSPMSDAGSLSPGANNNNSSAKSRIPVFRQKSKQS